ncbi:AC4 [Cotton yellow mosaic virus]|uniref:AC4 n=1 Tax=Cotton yellow mosaic virus TaxID=79236 RepID=A0A189WH78_9GEMI|nr:AC4 [Cotton yellow mosaic virus]YP_010839294.1 AC4 [Cotton yellow mosaic virus]ALO02634.1 AC4 [Cotton yellow mosaic virus]ANJ70952.1 AC4 [Cotton yellow mosaic virus]ANJ70958.1 AC4 [Cotton yellow mosaic virus]
MGNRIFMCCCSSRANSHVPTIASSIVYTQAVAPVSTPTFRELNQARTSSRTWTKTETPSNGDSFRSMGDLQEEVKSLQMTLTPEQLTREVSRKLLA